MNMSDLTSKVIYPWNMYDRQDKLGMSSNLVKAKMRYSPGKANPQTLPKYVKNLIESNFGKIGVTIEQPETFTVKSPVTTSMVSSLPPGVTAVTRIVHKTAVSMQNIMVFNGSDIYAAPPKKHVVTYGVTPTPAIVVTPKLQSKTEKLKQEVMHIKTKSVTPRKAKPNNSVTLKRYVKKSVTKPNEAVTLVTPVTPVKPVSSNESVTDVLDEMCNTYLSQESFENVRQFCDISDKCDTKLVNTSIHEFDTMYPHHVLQSLENVTKVKKDISSMESLQSKKSMKPKKKSNKIVKLSDLNISMKMFKEQYKNAQIVKYSGLSEYH